MARMTGSSAGKPASRRNGAHRARNSSSDSDRMVSPFHAVSFATSNADGLRVTSAGSNNAISSSIVRRSRSSPADQFRVAR